MIVAKQPYIPWSVHFLDNGNSVLICYLESGQVYVHMYKTFLIDILFLLWQFLLLGWTLELEMTEDSEWSDVSSHFYIVGFYLMLNP